MTPADSSNPIGNILIVDDTPNNLRLLSSMLKRQGYEVRSAISGHVALMAIHTALPDLILLDINMPKMNGYEVCERLKSDEQTRDIPVIFLSALSETVDKVKAFQVGGSDYITKPFQFEEVVARVENQLSLRRMQLKLKHAQENALHALDREKELNRLKSEFVALISHDFRTPLTSIQGFSGLLRHMVNPTEETQQRYFDKIDTAVEHLLKLLDEILLIGSLESGYVHYNPQPLSVESFCLDIVETLQLNTERKCPIQCVFEENLPTVELDPTMLRQILTNLLSNSIKYSPDNSVIDLGVKIDDSQIIFEIGDRGIGIPEKEQHHLFETFYRCSNVNQIKGTGLGLAIVKRCVELHRGHVSLESQEGIGTHVTVKLPITPKEVLETAGASLDS
jgi:signal transduction histidine kinase